MIICQGCGGVVGRDCFNQQECAWITQEMERVAAAQPHIEATQRALEAFDLTREQLHHAEQACQLVATGWKWQMLPNGARGWYWDGFLRDNELKHLLACAGEELPKELV